MTTIKEELNITQEEQEFIVTGILEHATKLFKESSKEYTIEAVETAIGLDHTNVDKITIHYTQSFTKADIEVLLNKYRKFNKCLEMEKN